VRGGRARCHFYGLTRDELAYILDTFPIVRRRDEERYGEYRTKRMVLESHEKLAGYAHRRQPGIAGAQRLVEVWHEQMLRPQE
jgi:hypothetical protein